MERRKNPLHGMHAAGAKADKDERTGSWEAATAGTYLDAHTPRGVFVVVLMLALLIACVPSVGLLWARTDTTTENRELAAFPSATLEDGSLNENMLADLGSYFNDHFAYRNQLVAANARLRGALGVSPTDQVVVGSDGWLYYGGTLPDYLGQSALSDRALRGIAHNLALAQAYVEAHGAQFAFAIAPNKSTLYPQHMPYYYLQSTEPSNADRLKPLLEEAGVHYVDLFDLFRGESAELYLRKDSHWDNRGALMASQALLATFGHAPLSLDVAQAESRTDFAGDLESMLYPVGASPDLNWYFPGVNDGAGMIGSQWSYEQGQDVTDGLVVTSTLRGRGSLLMFRDSFGNALLPYFATAFRQGVFSKYIPYNLPQMIDCHADAVIIERAERHLSYLTENPPIMPSPAISLRAQLPLAAEETRTTLDVCVDGSYVVVTGVIDADALSDEARILVSVERPDGETVVYDAFWTCGSVDGGAQEAFDTGFLVYLNSAAVDLGSVRMRVYAYDEGVLTCLGVFEGFENALE